VPRTSAPKPRARKQLELEPVEHYVGYQVRRAQLLIYDDFMLEQASEPGVPMTPGQLTVLLLIHADPEMTQRTLCDHMKVDKSTLAVSLDRMTRSGYLRRVRSTTDRRQNGLRLTPKGATRLKAMMRYLDEHEQRITAKLSAAERETLIALLRKVG
jgi:DNA-binding MarR family transcriptional regulator